MRYKTLLFLLFFSPSLVCAEELVFNKAFDPHGALQFRREYPVRLAFDGPRLYVLWQEAGFGPDRILRLAYSDDAGAMFQQFTIYSGAFTPPIEDAEVAASDGVAHVVYILGASRQLLYHYRLLDGKEPVIGFLEDRVATASLNPRVAASGPYVYVAWNDWHFGSNVHLRYSCDWGETWSEPINLTQDPDQRNVRRLIDLVASGSDVYVRWEMERDRQPLVLHGRIDGSKLQIE